MIGLALHLHQLLCFIYYYASFISCLSHTPVFMLNCFNLLYFKKAQSGQKMLNGGYMHYFKYVFCILVVLLTLADGFAVAAENRQNSRKEGPYLVVEGNVTQISARMLVVDGQQYPISKFAQVYEKSEKGPTTSSVQRMAEIGKIEKARLYILGGKVERIIVIVQLY